MIMKKITGIILAVALLFSLSACAVPEKADDPALTMDVLKEAEEITVHLYKEKEEKSLSLEVTEELLQLTKGKWEKRSGRPDSDKVLTLTVGTQHEITFFENGEAMIYYGYATVIEKDRCYYNVTLDGELSDLYDWCLENGTVPEDEE